MGVGKPEVGAVVAIKLFLKVCSCYSITPTEDKTEKFIIKEKKMS